MLHEYGIFLVYSHIIFVVHAVVIYILTYLCLHLRHNCVQTTVCKKVLVLSIY